MSWAASALRSKVIELRLAAGSVHRLERVEGDRGAEGDDVVDRLVLGQLGLQRGDDGRVVGAVDLDVLGARVPCSSRRRTEPRGPPSRTPGSRRASSCRPPRRSARPADSPARVSSEPKYISAPRSLYWSMPELNATTGILADVRVLHGPGQGVRGGQGGGDAVHLGVDGVLDQRGLLAGVRVVGVLQVDAVVLGGLLGSGLDLVPEGVTRSLVGDHGDGVAGVVARAATSVLLSLLGVRAAAGPVQADRRTASAEAPTSRPPVRARDLVMSEFPFLVDPEWPWRWRVPDSLVYRLCVGRHSLAERNLACQGFVLTF